MISSTGMAGALLAAAAAVIVAGWAWLGAPVQMPSSPLAPSEKVHCISYADVWEFWLRYREIASEVDFVTIHILPYWEDFPISAEHAAAHVDSIRRRVAAAFPGKEILLGEFGWPSAGRMREGALPSPVNQVRTMHEVLRVAKRENYRVNLIEAYDQPWKRQLEGTVGGHWGLFDAYRRSPKFTWGGRVSDHPLWRW